jgi:hypothetical protein
LSRLLHFQLEFGISASETAEFKVLVFNGFLPVDLLNVLFGLVKLYCKSYQQFIRIVKPL